MASSFADYYIVQRYCDRPMAEKKGYLKQCNKDCKNCACCIVMFENGTKEHIDLIGERKGANSWT